MGVQRPSIKKTVDVEKHLESREKLPNMSSGNSDRKKYKHLTVMQRLDIVKKLGESVPPKHLAEQFGVTIQTIYSIKKNATNLVQEVDKKHHIDKKTKKIKGPMLQELDNKLYIWFAEQSAIGNIMSDKLLQQKAEELNANFGGPSTFSCNRAWIWRFKRRHGIGGKAEPKDDDAKGKEEEEETEENSCRLQDEDVAKALDIIVEWSKQFDLFVQWHANGLKKFFNQERKSQ